MTVVWGRYDRLKMLPKDAAPVDRGSTVRVRHTHTVFVCCAITSAGSMAEKTHVFEAEEPKAFFLEVRRDLF
jgi:hypothetical protein